MMKIDYIQLLRKMIRIPSFSFEEEAVCSLISSELNAHNIGHQILEGNIIALNKTYSKDKKTLALCAHMDTVPAAEGYTRDPFDPGCEEDVIYGLGSNDDGGSVAAMIATFCHFYEREMPVNLMLIISREEERSGPQGCEWIFGKDGPFADGSLPHPDWAIVGEPTGMKAATSERGLLVIDGEAQGVSGHAARGNGINALYIALEDIAALRAHRFGRISPVMGEVKLNVTQIEAGKAHNIIPDSCRFVVDVRPTEQYGNEEILDELQSLCRSRLKARKLTNRSSATAPDSALRASLKRLGIECFSSPTTSDWMRLDCDAVKMGPGLSERSHKADEFIMRREIEEAIDKYIQFIEDFYGNTLE